MLRANLLPTVAIWNQPCPDNWLKLRPYSKLSCHRKRARSAGNFPRPAAADCTLNVSSALIRLLNAASFTHCSRRKGGMSCTTPLNCLCIHEEWSTELKITACFGQGPLSFVAQAQESSRPAIDLANGSSVPRASSLIGAGVWRELFLPNQE